ncbi:MAG TPA: branched-chain amino acid ABC transporter permease [Egibacteraceae bacterium]
MTTFLQLVISGLATGSIYGLIALGFVLIYKATDVFNFAHGDVMALGAFFAFTAVVSMGLPLWVALPAVLLAAALIGVLIQGIIVRPMLGQPLLSIVMATLGLSLIIRALEGIVFGSIPRTMPTLFPNRTLVFAGLRVSTLDLFIMAVSLVALGLFALFFVRSNLGLEMRATAEDYEAASLTGINGNKIFTVALALGSVLAATGGMLLGQVTLVNIHMGDLGLLAALPAIVIGGMTSIPGAVIGGLLVGVLDKLALGYIGGGSQNAVVYAALLVVLMIRPYGLFGERDIIRV